MICSVDNAPGNCTTRCLSAQRGAPEHTNECGKEVADCYHRLHSCVGGGTCDKILFEVSTIERPPRKSEKSSSFGSAMKRFAVAVGFYSVRCCERGNRRKAIKCGIH